MKEKTGDYLKIFSKDGGYNKLEPEKWLYECPISTFWNKNKKNVHTCIAQVYHIKWCVSGAKCPSRDE